LPLSKSLYSSAEAIARQVGLLIGETKEQVAKRLGKPLSAVSENQYRAVVVHGDTIDTLSGLEWEQILSKKEVVFARY
jgi:sodium/potassium-transporting ATPase subunit alpha